MDVNVLYKGAANEKNYDRKRNIKFILFYILYNNINETEKFSFFCSILLALSIPVQNLFLSVRFLVETEKKLNWKLNLRRVKKEELTGN